MFADTGELKNIYNAGINRVINEDGFIVSLSDNSRDYVSNATAENVSVSDGKVYSAVNYRLNLKTSEKTKSVSIPDRATAVVSYKNQCAVLLDNGTVQVFGSGDFEEKKTNGNDGSNDDHNSSKIKKKYMGIVRFYRHYSLPGSANDPAECHHESGQLFGQHYGGAAGNGTDVRCCNRKPADFCVQSGNFWSGVGGKYFWCAVFWQRGSQGAYAFVSF